MLTDLPDAQALPSPIRLERGDGRAIGADGLPEAQTLPSLNRLGGGDGSAPGADGLPRESSVTPEF